MTTRVVSDERRSNDAECLFAWSRKNDSRLPMLGALMITSAAFVFMLHSLRVDLGSQATTRDDHAALILAGSDAIGIELKRRAREEGPFPLRFDPLGDEAVVKLQQAALDARPAVGEGADQDAAGQGCRCDGDQHDHHRRG